MAKTAEEKAMVGVFFALRHLGYFVEDPSTFEMLHFNKDGFCNASTVLCITPEQAECMDAIKSAKYQWCPELNQNRYKTLPIRVRLCRCAASLLLVLLVFFIVVYCLPVVEIVELSGHYCRNYRYYRFHLLSSSWPFKKS